MKKRISVMLMAVVLMLATVGCGVQDKFLKAVGSLQDNNFVEFSMSIEDFDLGKEAGLEAIASQVKNLKVNGDVLTEGKDKTSFKMNLNIDLMGSKIPLEMISNNDKMYLSANYVTSISKLMGSALGTANLSGKLDERLKGKYIDMAEGEAVKNNTKDVEKDSKEMQNVIKKHLKEIDKSKFSEKEGKLTCSLDKKDVITLMKDLGKYLENIYPGYKEINDGSLEKVDTLNMDITVDEKEKVSEILTKVETKSEESTESVTLKLEMKHSKSEEKIKTPNSENIISPEELEKIMNEFYAQSFGGF